MIIFTTLIVMLMEQQECFQYLGYKENAFPESEKAAKEVVALPIYPELTDDMKNYVVDAVLSSQ